MAELNFKKISLEDKPIFDKYFNNFPPVISEYTFSNLFVWRNSRDIQYAIHNDGLVILATYKDDQFFMMPFGYDNIVPVYEYIANHAEKNGYNKKFARVDSQHAQILSKAGFSVTEDRDNFDYVYKAEDLAFLKGRKFSNKRGMMRKFSGEYYHKYWEFTSKCVNHCLTLTERWMESKGNDEQSNIDEYHAIKEFLTHIEHLDATGGVLCIEDGAVAYAFGEKLNNNTFVVHFEKADAIFAGVYQTINKLFAENQVFGQYEFINREQDLGIEGLRKAKQSYSPVDMPKKYIITM